MVRVTAMIVACVALFYGTATASRAVIDYDIFIFDGQLMADIDFENLLSTELAAEIRKGFPLHLDLRVELRESLPIWFDPILQTFHARIEIEYLAFGARYDLRVSTFDGGIQALSYKKYEELVADLKDFLVIQAGNISHFKPEMNLYFCFTLEQRRLTARELGQASDWYRGKEHKREDTVSDPASRPGQLLEQLISIAGLGPTRQSLKSHIFKPAELRNLKP